MKLNPSTTLVALYLENLMVLSFCGGAKQQLENYLGVNKLIVQ